MIVDESYEFFLLYFISLFVDLWISFENIEEVKIWRWKQDIDSFIEIFCPNFILLLFNLLVNTFLQL